MLFAEMVLQGVRNFSQTHRFPLGAGFTVFAGAAGAGKTSLVDLLVHLLYPDATEPATDAFSSQAADVCRAALTIDDGKGQVYRLVKDLQRGSTALTRFDADAGGFAPISSSPAEILQYLSSSLHLPQRDVFEGIFVTRGGDLPSAAAVRVPGLAAQSDNPLGMGDPPSAMRPSQRAADRRLPVSPAFAHDGRADDGPRFPGYRGAGLVEDDGEALPDDPNEIRAQIESLERDLQSARQADDLQFKLDGLQSSLFELEAKTKGVREAKEHAERIRESLQAFSKLGALPDDLENRITAYGKDRERYERELKRVDQERDRWARAVENDRPVALIRDRNFLLGLAGGSAALLVGLSAFWVFEPLRWVALLDIVFFAVALVAAIRHVDRVQGLEHSRARLASLDERRQKIERQFELESSIVRRAVEQLEAESPAQVAKLIAERRKRLASLAEAERFLTERKAQAGGDAVESSKATLQAEIEQIEAQLIGQSSLMMSPADMETRLAGLREKLARLESGGQAVASARAPGADPHHSGVGLTEAPYGAAHGDDLFGPQPASSTTGDRAASADGALGASAGVVRRLVALAEDLFLADAEKLDARISQRAAQFAAGLTNGAYTRLSFGRREGIVLVEGSSGATVAFADLPAEFQDLVYLALKLAFVESFCKQQAVPVFLDDPFRRLETGALDLIGRLLAGVGRVTQVVLYTAQPELARYATASYSL